jgi:hypothetical protein
MQNHMVDFPFALSSAFVMFVERRWAFVLSMSARRSTTIVEVWLKFTERTSLSQCRGNIRDIYPLYVCVQSLLTQQRCVHVRRLGRADMVNINVLLSVWSLEWHCFLLWRETMVIWVRVEFSFKVCSQMAVKILLVSLPYVGKYSIWF